MSWLLRLAGSQEHPPGITSRPRSILFLLIMKIQELVQSTYRMINLLAGTEAILCVATDNEELGLSDPSSKKELVSSAIYHNRLPFSKLTTSLRGCLLLICNVWKLPLPLSCLPAIIILI